MISNMDIHIKRLGKQDYVAVWQAMQAFTAQRNEHTVDELWLVEHYPVYTLGQAGKPSHLLRENGIPVVKIDRGGQITYHAPGQVIIYLLVDIARRGIKVREFVCLIEQAVIDCLNTYGIHGERKSGAPGIYVDGAKISALGLRIRHGCSYHGVALNVNMDLQAFNDINPCGYVDLQTTQMSHFGVSEGSDVVAEHLADHLVHLIRQHQTKA